MHKLINAVLFQAIWFSAVLVGWHLAIVPLALLCCHAFTQERDRHQLGFIAPFVLAGITLDALLFNIGWFQLPNPEVVQFAGMPLWLMIMWLAFSLTLASSLSWHQQWPRLFVLACAIAGPLSYFGGMRLGALSIQPEGFVALSLVWLSAGVLIVKVLPGMSEGKLEPKERSESRSDNTVIANRSVHGLKSQICGVE